MKPSINKTYCETKAMAFGKMCQSAGITSAFAQYDYDKDYFLEVSYSFNELFMRLVPSDLFQMDNPISVGNIRLSSDNTPERKDYFFAIRDWMKDQNAKYFHAKSPSAGTIRSHRNVNITEERISERTGITKYLIPFPKYSVVKTMTLR